MGAVAVRGGQSQDGHVGGGILVDADVEHVLAEGRGVVVDILHVDGDVDGSGALREPAVVGHHLHLVGRLLLTVQRLLNDDAEVRTHAVHVGHDLQAELPSLRHQAVVLDVVVGPSVRVDGAAREEHVTHRHGLRHAQVDHLVGELRRVVVDVLQDHGDVDDHQQVVQLGGLIPLVHPDVEVHLAGLGGRVELALLLPVQNLPRANRTRVLVNGELGPLGRNGILQLLKLVLREATVQLAVPRHVAHEGAHVRFLLDFVVQSLLLTLAPGRTEAAGDAHGHCREHHRPHPAPPDRAPPLSRLGSHCEDVHHSCKPCLADRRLITALSS